MKKIFTTSLIVIASILSLGQVALAASATLSAQPSYSNNVLGSTFNTAVEIDPANNKVCVVKGTLAINNLTCQNITLAPGLIAQTAPTCSTPSFTVGIPRCTTSKQNLFTVSVKGNTPGQASISFSDVKVIGVGEDVAFNYQTGVYNIVAVPYKAPEIVIKKPVVEVIEPAATTTISTTTLGKIVTSTKEVISNAGAILLAIFASGYIWQLVIILVVFSLAYGIYYSAKRKVEGEKKEEEKKEDKKN